MSWDVCLVKTNTNSEQSVEDIAEVVDIATREEFAELLAAAYPDSNCDDLSWLILNTDSFSIEFNVGDEPVIDSIMLHIRGSEEPTAVIQTLCTALACRAIDTSTGEFMDFEQPSGFSEWKTYRDKIINKGTTS